MTNIERRGLELILSYGHVLAGRTGLDGITFSNDAMNSINQTKTWILRQLEIDTTRSKPRGRYRRLR